MKWYAYDNRDRVYTYNNIGVAEHETLPLARGLENLGHDFIFLATNSREEGKFSEGEEMVVKIPRWHTFGWS